MIRSFQFHDWNLLKRLYPHSVPLSVSSLLLNPTSPLYQAITHQWFDRDLLTYVWRPKARDAEAFVQLQLCNDQTQAYLQWIGSTSKSNTNVKEDDRIIWLDLFERLLIELGDRGVQTVIAEVAEESDVQATLKQAGFVNYARQDIWCLTQLPNNHQAPLGLMYTPRTTHEWDVALFYSHIVPNMLRFVEKSPPAFEECWVHYEGVDLVAYATMQIGKIAQRLHLFVDLSAETDTDLIVASIIAQHPPTPKLPIYCCVRSYQDWLNNALRRNGFEYYGSQVMMAKHTVQFVVKPEHSLEKLLHSGTVSAQSSTIIQKTNSFTEDRRKE